MAKDPALTRRARRSKAKGRALEKRVAEEVRAWTNLSEDDIKLSRASYSGIDLEMSEKAKRAWSWGPECKNHKSLKVPAWIKQAEENAGLYGLKPVIVFKQHGDGTLYVIIRFEHFMELSTNHLV